MKYYSGLIQEEAFDILQISVRFPLDAFLLEGTFPSPARIVVFDTRNVVIWEFASLPGNQALSVGASYGTITDQTNRDILLFLSGMLVAVAIPLFFEGLKRG